MKSIKSFFFFVMLSVFYFSAKSQFDPCLYIDFEDKSCLLSIYPDTISNPNNIWQIGQPQKIVFDSAYQGKNVLVTDTIQSYPLNDTSYYVAFHAADLFAFSCYAAIAGMYYVDSDSLSDYGTIEISYDTGKTWINIIDSTIYSDKIYWDGDVPILTGNSNGWKSFHVRLGILSSHFNIKQHDLVYFRFGFVSDSVSDTLDGLMFDELSLADYCTGIENGKLNFINSKSFPNPACKKILIEFENENKNLINLYLFDSKGIPMDEFQISEKSSIEVNLSNYPSGNYYYKVLNLISGQMGSGKFMILK